MNEVIDNKAEWKNLVKELKKLDGQEVVVGLQSKDKYPGRKYIADIGAQNEFGVPSKNIPSRPFMRSTFDEQQKKWTNQFGKLIKSGNLKPLDIMGLQMQKDIVGKITNGPFAPNSPVTIMLKGSDTPLIDTGRMRASIRYKVRRIKKK